MQHEYVVLHQYLVGFYFFMFFSVARHFINTIKNYGKRESYCRTRTCFVLYRQRSHLNRTTSS